MDHVIWSIWKRTLGYLSWHLKSGDIHKENTFLDIEIPIHAIIFHNDDVLNEVEISVSNARFWIKAQHADCLFCIIMKPLLSSARMFKFLSPWWCLEQIINPLKKIKSSIIILTKSFSWILYISFIVIFKLIDH